MGLLLFETDDLSGVYVGAYKRPANRGKSSKAKNSKRKKPKVASLKEIIPLLFKKIGLATGRNRQIQEAWREVAGDELSHVTRVVAFRGGVLYIEVASAPVLHELEIYYKKDFLKLLRSRLSWALTSLKFRLAAQRAEDFLEDRAKPPPSYRF